MERYDIGEYDSGMVPCSDGDWAEYEEAQQEIETLRRQLEVNQERRDMLSSSLAIEIEKHNEWKRRAKDIWDSITVPVQKGVMVFHPEAAEWFEEK